MRLQIKAAMGHKGSKLFIRSLTEVPKKLPRTGPRPEFSSAPRNGTIPPLPQPSDFDNNFRNLETALDSVDSSSNLPNIFVGVSV